MGAITVELVLSLLKRFWYMGPMVGLAIALLITRGTLHGARVKLGAARTALSAQVDAAAVTSTSLAAALARIDALNAAASAAAARLDADRTRAAADQAASDARFESTKSTIAGLIASSKRPRAACTLSPEARSALEGLTS